MGLKELILEAIPKCYKAPYGWGYEWVEKGYCDAYNIGQNVGTEAGLNCSYSDKFLSHVPKGDMEDPKRWSVTCDPEKGSIRR